MTQDATRDRDERRAEEAQRVVVRDRRRIDPESGAPREAAPDPEPTEATAAGAGTAEQALVTALESQLAERTDDLLRLKAEFDNYRKRVERDRVAVLEQSVAGVLVTLLPVLDDVDRARQHGELEGAFKSVAESLETAVEKLGLQRFGAAGDAFDPNVHEAVTHAVSGDVEVPTCTDVMRPGYRLADRLLRPAMVAVADPQEA